MAALVLDGIQVKRPRCQDAAQQGMPTPRSWRITVAKGVPFREAHHIVGEAVVEAIRRGKPLEALPLADLQKFSRVIGDDVYPILSLQSCLDKRAAKAAFLRSRWRRPSTMPWRASRYRPYKRSAIRQYCPAEHQRRRAFLKKSGQRSAKVHVGFSYFGFERYPLNGRCLQGLNEKPLRSVMYY